LAKKDAFMIVDQATRLRDLSKLKKQTEKNLHPVRRIAVTSGKGGVGKSNFSLNLAILFQKLGQRTLLIDADTNLANIDILLGIHPQYTLADVVLRGHDIQDIIVDGPEGLKILPAGSGVVEMVGLDSVVQDRIDRGMLELEQNRDAVILDTGAGIAEGVVEFASGADEVIVITTPEPTAITDAYAAIKVISTKNKAVKFHLLVNQAKNENEAQDVAQKIKLVVENYLTLNLEILGHLPKDNHIPEAVSLQKPFVLSNPRCQAALNLIMIARRLLKLPANNTEKGSLFRHLFTRGEKIG
jgi:flagellar biosynthesis protein FlhG